MQTIIHINCTKGKSLRKQIGDDEEGRGKYKLVLTKHKNQKRSHGWAEYKSGEPDTRGALKVKWLSETQTLECRIVTDRPNKPHKVAGDFISYMIARYSSSIRFITIFTLNQRQSKRR